MISYDNIQRYNNMPFEEYLNLKGMSFSHLKSLKDGVKREIKITNKILVGKAVDAILTNDTLGELELSQDILIPAINIADKIKSEWGEVIKSLTPQVSYHAKMYDDEKVMSIVTTGRLDWLLGKAAVVDLKITNDAKNAFDCEKLVEWMGYDNQIFNYGGLAGVKHHFLLMYSTRVNKTFLLKRLVKEEDRMKANKWWNDKISEYGEVVDVLNY